MTRRTKRKVTHEVNKVKRKKMFSPIRWDVVLALRSKLRRYKNMTLHQKIVAIFETINHPDVGISKKEIALTIREKQTEQDRNGKTIPTFKSLDQTGKDLSKFRYSEENKGMTPCYWWMPTGEVLYFAMQKESEYDENNLLKDRVVDGLEDHRKVDLEQIKKPKEQKQKYIDEVMASLEPNDNGNSKSKKKKKDDDSDK